MCFRVTLQLFKFDKCIVDRKCGRPGPRTFHVELVLGQQGIIHRIRPGDGNFGGLLVPEGHGEFERPELVREREIWPKSCPAAYSPSTVTYSVLATLRSILGSDRVTSTAVSAMKEIASVSLVLIALISCSSSIFSQKNII